MLACFFSQFIVSSHAKNLNTNNTVYTISCCSFAPKLKLRKHSNVLLLLLSSLTVNNKQAKTA